MTTPIISTRRAAVRPTTFRAEIQALRAVAVAVVVLFHLWPHRLTGGFVGVDIFFVISGYLITRHLMKEADATGRISIPQFWAKRARRLLPASMLVLLVSAAGVVLFIPQMYWQLFLKQIAASAVYAQNWVLASDSIQYFAAENNASPVQHFWSLSVEEQFYLVWPLLIVGTLLITRRLTVAGRRRAVTVALALVGAASLAYSVHLTAVSPGPAYFVTPTRAWEFAAGGLLALLGTATGGALLRNLVSWAGWAVIAATVVMFSPATAFPGYMALIPVLGTIAVIWAGSPDSRWAPSSYLGIAPIRSLGNISYSVYLWHWPFIVFATMAFDDFHWRAKLMIIAATLLAAWATTALVENPVREGKWLIARKPRVTFLAMVTAMLIIAAPTYALSTHMGAQGAAEAVRSAAAASTSGPCFGAGVSDKTLDCEGIVYDKLTPNPMSAADDLPEVYANGCYSELDNPALNTCVTGKVGAPFRVALIGDSHAAHWYPAVKRLAVEQGWELSPFMKSACPQSAAPKRDEVVKVFESCRDWNDALAASMAAAKPFDLVIVSHSSTGDRGYGAPAAAVAGFQTAWQTLTAAGSKVVVIRDVPQAKESTTACVAENADGSSVCDLNEASALGNEDLMVTAATGQPGVTSVDMSRYFCAADLCSTVRGGVVIYRDSHHITATYATTLAPYLLKELVKAGVTE